VDRTSTLNDYAHHQFAGLLSNYYARRWEAFFANPDHADAALDALEASAPSAAWTMPPRGGDLLKLASAVLALGVLCTAEKNAGAVAKEIYLAGGCFWGTEHYFKMIAGVVDTEVGYANGVTANPTYKEVCSDKTRFAETVRVVYDPAKVGLRFLLEMYFKAVDPVSVNRQGHDVGSQYRTGIYYVDKDDIPVIDEAWRAEQARHAQPLAVEKLPLVNFYAAEEYHQDYLEKNPRSYCHLPAALFKLAREAKPQRAQ